MSSSCFISVSGVVLRCHFVKRQQYFILTKLKKNRWLYNHAIPLSALKIHFPARRPSLLHL